MLKTTSAEFSFIEILFKNQNNEPLEIEDSVNITLIIGSGKTLILKKYKFYKTLGRE